MPRGTKAATPGGAAPISSRFHVYAPDLPGFGGSERPAGADYSISMQVEALRGFMAAVGIGKARVAGLSMGGWIACRLAASHPELVERLVALDAAGMRPVLVVWGKHDRLIPVAHARRLQAELPRAELVMLDGCGHEPMADCPEAFERVFVRFLEADL